MSSIFPTTIGRWAIIGSWAALLGLVVVATRTHWARRTKEDSELVANLRTTLARPNAKFSFHADLPRLARKVFIYTKDFKTLSPPDDSVEAVKQLILAVAEHFHDWNPINPADYATQVKEALIDTFDSGDHVPDLQLRVKKFLEDHGELIGPSVMSILKTVTQDIVAPAVIKMKTELSSKMPYKDVRGDWYIHINFEDPEQILVSHHKREQSFELDAKERFEFQWNLDMIFNPDAQVLKDATLYVPTLIFGAETSQSYQDRNTRLLDGYLLSK